MIDLLYQELFPKFFSAFASGNFHGGCGFIGFVKFHLLNSIADFFTPVSLEIATKCIPCEVLSCFCYTCINR